MSSFHTSASNIRVDDGHILRARLRNGNGEEVDSELDLNSCIGNSGGRFSWGSRTFAIVDFDLDDDHSLTLSRLTDFSDSAENIYFSVEGDAQVPILRARLRGPDDQTFDADINLGERIGNDNGNLNFCKPFTADAAQPFLGMCD
ncbi:hypothetical protein PWT90_07910 [Aphanocladium album]|nr:hypothetical protein PWT90_07910 [Aphanocladium album]